MFDTPVCSAVVSMPSTMKRFSEPDAPSIMMPPPRPSCCVPGAELTTCVKSRPFGMRSMRSDWMLSVDAFCLTSMIGDSAITWTDSDSAATAIPKSTLRICPSCS